MNDEIDDPNEQWNEAMLAIRELMSSEGTMARWHQLVALLTAQADEWLPEQQTLLFSYIDAHILGWAPQLIGSLYHWWLRAGPDAHPLVQQLARKILDWCWSPGTPGERRPVPGIPNAHVVWVPASDPTQEPLWVWQTPVTQEQFQSIMGYNPSYFKGTAEHPVERVTWHVALAFCRELSRVLRLDTHIQTTGKRLRVQSSLSSASWTQEGRGYFTQTGFRLPTEREWEQYSQPTHDTPVLDECAWFAENAFKLTHPVKTKRPNQWKLYDTFGNVLEWCIDTWQEGDDTTESYLGDPGDPELWSTNERVLRGGSWHHPRRKTTFSQRDRAHATSNLAHQGFRPVRSTHDARKTNKTKA
jgi:formylglycine-generating enzyme required for sulfatase activity